MAYFQHSAPQSKLADYRNFGSKQRGVYVLKSFLKKIPLCSVYIIFKTKICIYFIFERTLQLIHLFMFLSFFILFYLFFAKYCWCGACARWAFTVMFSSFFDCIWLVRRLRRVQRLLPKLRYITYR